MGSIQQIFSSGTHPRMSITLQKQLVLANYVGVVIGILNTLVAIKAIIAGTPSRALIMSLPAMLFVLVPLLNKYAHHLVTRFVVANLYPVVLLVTSLIYKLTLSSGFALMEVVQPSLTLSLYSAVAIAVFEPKREGKYFTISATLSFATLLIYDPLNNYFGVGYQQAFPVWEGYPQLIIHKVILGAGCFAVFRFLKRISLIYEERLDEKNNMLKAKQRETQAQNEEMRQQQEEILTQREAIAIKNEELTFTNAQIEDSIRAALTIQQAVLPYQKKLEQLLKDYFILYRPKDIVSGDFYWIGAASGYKVVCVIDCTGHGIPGAFMTLIGNTLLDKIIRMRKVTNPSYILEAMDDDIRVMLQQDETGSHSGMDMSVCVWKEPTEPNQDITLEFAGAKSNICTFNSQTQAFDIYKGTRRGVAGRKPRKHKPFEVHRIQLPAQSTVYAYTDGYSDQNNIMRKRIGATLFHKTLQNNAQKDLQAQKEQLIQLLENHQEGVEQRDDICVLGFQV